MGKGLGTSFQHNTYKHRQICADALLLLFLHPMPLFKDLGLLAEYDGAFAVLGTEDSRTEDKLHSIPTNHSQVLHA